MSTNVTYKGTSYSIPAAGEVNWSSLSNFLIALGQNAPNTTYAVQAIRVATTSPVTVSATTDYAVISNLSVAGAVAVALPAGVNGQIFVIGDGKPDAGTNNITITPNGAETIKGGATLVLNHNSQMVMIQYHSATTDWKVLANVIYPGTIVSADLGEAVSIAKGGTGQTSQTAAFDALAPTTTSGDIIYHNGSDNVRLAKGSDGQALILASGLPSWSAITPTLDSPLDLINIKINATVASDALTIALKDKAGSDPSAGSPVKIAFRNATATTGDYVVRSVTGALSLVVPDTATLGCTASLATNLWAYAIDNSGTVELGVSQILYPEGVYSSTTIGTGADSNNVIYSGTGRSNVAMRPIGRITIAIGSSGHWSNAASQISLATDSVLADGDPIIATYTSTTTSNVTASIQFMDWATKIVDTKSAVTGAGSGLNGTYTNTWRFVAPRAGNYRVSYNIVATSAASAQGVLLNTQVNVNGSTATGMLMTGIQQGTGAYIVSAVNPGLLVALTSGQAISVGISNNTTPTDWPLVAGGRNSITIEYVGATP